MTVQLNPVPTAAFGAVVVSWLVFAAVFLFGRKPPRAPAARKDPVSLVGIGLQMVAYALAWMLARAPLTPILPAGPAVEIVLAAITAALAAASTWLAISAVRTLGRQWSLSARLVEGHKLIRTGPYGRVRHPIYTAMMGMLL